MLDTLFKTCFKDLHSLSYQGLEGKLFIIFFLLFEIVASLQWGYCIF